MDEIVEQKNDRSEAKASRFGLAGRVLRALGPGLVTGAADDDPSGIATYSQVGAQFGYELAWILLFSYPLMAAMQEIAARIGCVTGLGIAQNLRRHYPRWLLRSWCCSCSSPMSPISAPISARWARRCSCSIGGPALALYCHPRRLLRRAPDLYELSALRRPFLKWLTLSLFTYVVVAFAVDVPWGEALKSDHSCRRQFQFRARHGGRRGAWHDHQPLSLLLAGGTGGRGAGRGATLPLYVTPASRRRDGAHAHRHLGRHGAVEPHRAVHRHRHGGDAACPRRDRHQTSAQAAEALRPIAGIFTFFVFAPGIIGTGLLADSGAGRLGRLCGLRRRFNWVEGLDHKLKDARAFYGVIAAGDPDRPRAQLLRASIRSRRSTGARCSTAFSRRQ